MYDFLYVKFQSFISFIQVVVFILLVTGKNKQIIDFVQHVFSQLFSRKQLALYYHFPLRGRCSETRVMHSHFVAAICFELLLSVRSTV